MHQYKAWEMLSEPSNLTAEETELAKELLKLMKIDLDDEHLISFRAAPIHFFYLGVQIIRRLERLRSGKFWPEIFYQEFKDSNFDEKIGQD